MLVSNTQEERIKVIINDLILNKTIPNLTDGKSYLLPLGSNPGKVKQKENRAQNKIKRTECTLKILSVPKNDDRKPVQRTCIRDSYSGQTPIGLSSVTTGRVWLILNAHKFM